MAVNCSPFGPKPQLELADGTPAIGNKLFTYVAGSVNTKQSTYTDSTGGSANSNPIVLNSLGQTPNELWFTAGLSYKVVYAPSTDTDPPTSPIWSIDNLIGISATTVTTDQWASGPAPTFVGATSFTLAGDQTSTFHPGRRVKTTNSGGTIYSTIVTSVFGALTTVTVVNDSGVLDAGLSAVFYGLQSAINPSTPLLIDTYPIASGSVDKTKKFRFELDGNTTATTRVATPPDYDFRIMSQTHGADIASATGAGTLNLDTATGDLIDVTGTTAITAITLADGKMATVRFTGALTLTNGASLVLPGAMSITTVAGDVAVFRGYAAGVVRCVNYSPITGGTTSGLSKLTSGAASGATLDIVMTAYTGFKNKVLVFESVIPATNNASLYLRTSTDGGATYAAGAANYKYGATGGREAGTALNSGSAGATQIDLTAGTNSVNTAAFGISGTVTLFDTTNTAMRPRAIWSVSLNNTTDGWTFLTGTGSREAAEDTDAIRLLFSAGNISSGTWTLYGYN